MYRSNLVTFVSAGMLFPKKRDNRLARRQLYLNYGALSLATLLQLNGHETLLIHGEHRSPEDVLEDLCDSGRFPSRYPLMLSIPSFYALPWAQLFCRMVKAADPECRIVVGGRWVVGPDTAWLRTHLPEADYLAPGLSEPIIEGLLTDSPVPHRTAVPTPSFTLNHKLIDQHLRYQPSVEASRGCGMGCLFCEERDIPVEKLGSPTSVAHSLALVQEQYGAGEIHPYLQSSMFLPTTRWAEALACQTQKAESRIAWRTETRVDVMVPDAVAALADAGLRVIDLGLESASPTQIVAMNKTPKPDRYLRKAEELLEACRRYGVLAKVNVLLYAGESTATFDETRAWLDDNASCITGVSVGPVIAYGPPKTASLLIDDWARYGAKPVEQDSADRTGITKMHLSDEFDEVAAEAASLELSRRYMDSDSYYALKSFSYYPRDYSRVDFDNDVSASNPASLPFRVPERENISRQRPTASRNTDLMGSSFQAKES